MADIRIQRPHALGLPKARKLARQWVDDVEKRFGMDCTVLEGESSDAVEFTRPGVSGRLIVAADRFDLQATLGFLLGPFSKRIEAEIEQNLDALLAAKGSPKAVARKAAPPRRKP